MAGRVHITVQLNVLSLKYMFCFEEKGIVLIFLCDKMRKLTCPEDEFKCFLERLGPAG